MNKTTCSSDPFTTRLLMSHLHAIIPIYTKAMDHFLVLDLSVAFDTIDHDNLFYILEKYVEIGDSALWLILSYFCDCTQRV